MKIASEELGRPTTGEDLVSGSGLERLHRVRFILNGRTVENVSAADITQATLSGDPFAVSTMNQFLLFLGTLASNAALATGARRGVLLAGGILPRIREVLVSSGFKERFVGQSPMASYLQDIPVNLIIAGDAALRGAYTALLRARTGDCATQI